MNKPNSIVAWPDVSVREKFRQASKELSESCVSLLKVFKEDVSCQQTAENKESIYWYRGIRHSLEGESVYPCERVGRVTWNKSEAWVWHSAGRYWFLETDTIFLIWNRYFWYIYFAEFSALEVLWGNFECFLVLIWYKFNKIRYFDIRFWCFSKPIMYFFLQNRYDISVYCTALVWHNHSL